MNIWNGGHRRTTRNPPAALSQAINDHLVLESFRGFADGHHKQGEGSQFFVLEVVRFLFQAPRGGTIENQRKALVIWWGRFGTCLSPKPKLLRW